MLSGLHDRNTTVKKTYASAIGHLVKVAKDSSVEKLIHRLKEWYFEKEGNRTHYCACPKYFENMVLLGSMLKSFGCVLVLLDTDRFGLVGHG